jgi:hypothetical protein
VETCTGHPAAYAYAVPVFGRSGPGYNSEKHKGKFAVVADSTVIDPPPAVKARDNRWREESAATRAWTSQTCHFSNRLNL